MCLIWGSSFIFVLLFRCVLSLIGLVYLVYVESVLLFFIIDDIGEKIVVVFFDKFEVYINFSIEGKEFNKDGNNVG